MQKRWSLSVPFEDFPLSELAGIARGAEALGYTDAFTGETDGCDPFTPLAAVALGTNMRVGTAIANVFTRGPQVLASAVAGMAELAPGRFVLGVGAGSLNTVERWNGVPYVRPATRVREVVQVLRPALAGEKVSFRGETLHVENLRLARPPKHPIPIHVAALRPSMLRLAGEVADGAILNWLSADDVHRSAAIVREAAEKAGRDPAALEFTARLFVSLDEPGGGQPALKRWVTAYLNVPTYRDFQRWLGRGEELSHMWDAWDAGDRRGALEAVSDTVLSELFIHGSPAERRAHLDRYFEAGIDTAFLHFITSDPDPARRRELVLQGIREMAPVLVS